MMMVAEDDESAPGTAPYSGVATTTTTLTATSPLVYRAASDPSSSSSSSSSSSFPPPSPSSSSSAAASSSSAGTMLPAPAGFGAGGGRRRGGAAGAVSRLCCCCAAVGNAGRLCSRSGQAIGWFARHATTDKNTRAMSTFVCLLFMLVVVQLLFGIQTNSLGVLSQAMHGIIDIISILITIIAVLLGKHVPTYRFSYGFQRFEVLSSFGNSIFLLFLLFFIIVEAIERICFPLQIHVHEQVIWTMVVSLCVDVVGAFLFHKQVRNLNLSVKGINTKREPLIGYQMASHEDTFLLVFFHALGHAFRNAGIILSYVMATTWGWQLADPLMSLFISLILVVTTIPVVIKHGKLLLQITPSTIYPKIYDATQAASMVEGVLEIRNEHFWTLSPGIYVGSLCVRVRSDASEEKIRQQIRGLYQNWLTHLTIEIDKDVWESIGGGAVGEQRHHRVFRQGGPIVGVTSSIGPGHL